MKPIASSLLLLLFLPTAPLGAEILVTGVKTDATDAAYGADASNSDLVNAGASSLLSATLSATPHFGPAAHNNGAVGTANTTADITFWLSATVGSTRSITYALNTSVNTLGYNITSIQTIHGWTSNSGYQKNQNYEVFVSTVGSPAFTSLATVAYTPYTTGATTASTKVNITENASGILASGIDEIRFTYTITGGGTQPSPTIREIDVFGSAVPLGPDLTPPAVSTLSPADNSAGVPLDSNLVITFNEAVVLASGDITILNLDTPSQITIPVGNAQLSPSGTVLTIDPGADLAPNTNHAIQIAATAVDDTAGNSFPGITNNTTWNFTTANPGVLPLAVTAPVIRQVVQRNGSNLGSIPVAGTATAGRVEARAVAPPNYDKNLGAIWFIGDSITQSNADGDANGSPRKSLHDLLVADGATFSFTGHSTANVDGLPASGGTAATNLYHYHSGVSGSCIGANSNGRTSMTANVPGWWNSGRLASTRPKIVLIMLGTNDIDLNDDVANAPARIKTLVDTIFAQVGPADPDPAIFVARIPPNTGSAPELQRVVDFNNALPAVIATLQGEGKDVTLVDQFSLLNANTAGLMRDSLHTNAAGNAVLGSQWFEAIKARFATTSSATTTPWQTIATNPNGAFSGALTGVSAGGWYGVEVRTVTAEIPVETVIINKVGVGDIYVTAGQSNSANHGSPAVPPADDRVVARTAVTGNSWALAADPLPIASGTGGSTWSRLGDLLAAAENIPVGFIAVGVGSTQVSQWVPGTSNYDNRLKPAIQSLPAQGFRGVLWHQGESDSIAGVSAATHASRLNSMISQSRIDAGWNVPWYLAEASFHPSSSLGAEERVAAGQRAAVHGDPLVFLGPSTDEFHLEDAAGGKLADSVHFNAAGLLDHATQWRDILRGTTVIALRNGGFEDNRTPAITNLPALADGTSHLVTTAGANDSPMVLDWRILAAGGVEAADGNNGFHNPTTGTFAGAVDSTGGGVLAPMDGPHAALLDGGSAGNHFLQSTRVAAQPDTLYTLTVALGIRDNPATFGNARLEITSNGSVVATATFDKAALDTLRGADTSGTFTDASVSWTTGATVAANHLLAVRVVKVGGAGTVLDFDKVRLTALPNTFSTWIDGFGLDPADRDFEDDPDLDGLANGLEAWFGTNPARFTTGLADLTTDGTITTFTHPRNADAPVDARSAFYDWCTDLSTWHPDDGGPPGGPTVTFVLNTIGTTTTVTATASQPLESLFLRVRVTGN